MPIDNYNQTFEYLSESELPAYLRKLQTMIEKPLPMSLFGTKGNGPVSIIRKISLRGDFLGCYVLLDKSKPIYVGISKRVIHRLRQHALGKSHFEASLAYRMALKDWRQAASRDQLMKQPKFLKLFANAKSYILTLNVAFVEIENPLAVYVFEPYCAMKLDTSEWNTFETH